MACDRASTLSGSAFLSLSHPICSGRVALRRRGRAASRPSSTRENRRKASSLVTAILIRNRLPAIPSCSATSLAVPSGGLAEKERLVSSIALLKKATFLPITWQHKRRVISSGPLSKVCWGWGFKLPNKRELQKVRTPMRTQVAPTSVVWTSVACFLTYHPRKLPWRQANKRPDRSPGQWTLKGFRFSWHCQQVCQGVVVVPGWSGNGLTLRSPPFRCAVRRCPRLKCHFIAFAKVLGASFGPSTIMLDVVTLTRLRFTSPILPSGLESRRCNVRSPPFCVALR